MLLTQSCSWRKWSASLRSTPGAPPLLSLLTSSVAIWVANVLTFSMLYWQIDGGGPAVRASDLSAKPDWVFPQPAKLEDLPPDWRPFFLDYLYLGYNTATAFSPPTLCRSRGAPK